MQLKQAQIDYNENPSFGAQGIIKDIQSQLKSIGFQLTEARKKKRLAPRKTEEIIFKTLCLSPMTQIAKLYDPSISTLW